MRIRRKALLHLTAAAAIFFLTDAFCSEVIGMVFRICDSVILIKILYLCFTIGSVLAAVFLYAKYVLQESLSGLYLGKPLPALRWGAAVMGMLAVTDAVSVLFTKGEFHIGCQTWEELVFVLFHEIFSSGLRTAMIEGIIFRGLSARVLSKELGDTAGAFAASFFYASVSVIFSNGFIRTGPDAAGVFPTSFLMGLAFSWMTCSTGSVWTSVLVHFLYNAFSGQSYILHIDSRQDFPAVFTYTVHDGSSFFTDQKRLSAIGLLALMLLVLAGRKKKRAAMKKREMYDGSRNLRIMENGKRCKELTEKMLWTTGNRKKSDSLTGKILWAMGNRKKTDSLTGKMLRDLLYGVAAGIYLMFVLYLGGRNMLQQYFTDFQMKETLLMGELQAYVRVHQVGVSDIRTLISWMEDQGICEFKIARDGWLLFDAAYPGMLLSGRKKQPSGSWRAYDYVSFADGGADVYLSTGFDQKYYHILFGIAVISGFAACLAILIAGMKENVAYIQRLKREVDAIRLGSLQEAVTIKGGDELGQLAVGLDQMRRQLYEKGEKEKELRAAQEKLVLGMAHDLRTPLTGLLAYMEVLKKQEREGKPGQKYIDKAYNKILQIRQLSDRMFEYFFIESQQAAVLEPPEDISSAFGDYLSELCAMLDCAGFFADAGKLQWKPALVRVSMDYMGRMINNIVSNVDKYGDREKHVEIRIIYEQERVGIAVKNGMAARGKYVEGTGIGVKNISSMMKQMGGTVQVHITEEDYKIVLYFPLHTAPVS